MAAKHTLARKLLPSFNEDVAYWARAVMSIDMGFPSRGKLYRFRYGSSRGRESGRIRQVAMTGGDEGWFVGRMGNDENRRGRCR